MNGTVSGPIPFYHPTLPEVTLMSTMGRAVLALALALVISIPLAAPKAAADLIGPEITRELKGQSIYLTQSGFGTLSFMIFTDYAAASAKEVVPDQGSPPYGIEAYSYIFEPNCMPLVANTIMKWTGATQYTLSLSYHTGDSGRVYWGIWEEDFATWRGGTTGGAYNSWSGIITATNPSQHIFVWATSSGGGYGTGIIHAVAAVPAVPIPPAALLLGSGLLTLAVYRWRKVSTR